MSRGKRNRRWLREHQRDSYVKSAKQAGYRSRSAYKLAQMDDRDGIFRPGQTVVDLGAAPGGWSQVAAARVAPGGRVIALDRLPMEALPGVTILQLDVLEAGLDKALTTALGEDRADVVMSDMAPNISGIRDVDQARALELALNALRIAESALCAPGTFLVKAFQGSDTDQLVAALHARFDRVDVRKPGASRDKSSEIYLLARGYGV
ncbi:MAG: RlmE family RNA methyltransferase [Gammaproteobacteria bacterium]|nr:RlmE family RNA methyltransferase [Gammaproteobacteria bacterium]